MGARKLIAVGTYAALLLYLTQVHAGDVSVRVADEVLDKVAAQYGPVTESGTYKVQMSYPCVHCTRKWMGICYGWRTDTCVMTVYDANWTATVSDVNFSIAPNSGVTFVATTDISYGPCHSHSSAHGTATIALAGNQLTFATDRITVPLNCSIAGIEFSVTTIDRALPFGFAVPFTGGGITNSATAADVANIHMLLEGNSLSLEAGNLVINTSPTFY